MCVGLDFLRYVCELVMLILAGLCDIQEVFYNQCPL